MGIEANTSIHKKKKRVALTKCLNLGKAWRIIGPLIAQEIGGPGYTHIPYFFDANAYQIGNIFVQSDTEVKCFRSVPVLKVLGPIRDFVVQAESNSNWLDKDFHAIKTTGDKVDFQVVVDGGKNYVAFTGESHYFLSKAQDMPLERNVKINRSSHEDLSRAKWFGLITNVVVARIFEIEIVKDKRMRQIYIGDKPHTVLFKYEICDIDDKGTVHKTRIEKIPCKWLQVEENDRDTLPLAEFVSQSVKKST